MKMPTTATPVYTEAQTAEGREGVGPSQRQVRAQLEHVSDQDRAELEHVSDQDRAELEHVSDQDRAELEHVSDQDRA